MRKSSLIESLNDNPWGEPFDGSKYEDIINGYSIENKIHLKNEPRHLYDVVNKLIGEEKTYSRICLFSRIKESTRTDKITKERIKTDVSLCIKSITPSPNYFLTLLGENFAILLIEVSINYI